MKKIKTIKHTKEDTHTVCNKRFEIEGKSSECCFCCPHADCELINE